MLKKIFFLLPLLVVVLQTKAQVDHSDEVRTFKSKRHIIPKDSSSRTFTYQVNLGFNQPFADLSQRYGSFKSLGSKAFYKSKSNWLLGVEGDYYFGTKVKEDSILHFLKTASGDIITNEGNFASIKLYARSYYIGATVGKILPILSHNKNSGLSVWFRAGYWQHRIKILGDNINQLQPDYKMGYDRLTTGFAIGQSVLYYHMSGNRLVNYTFGIEVLEGFMQGRRTINFDTMKSGLDKRFDVMAGVKLGWMLPVFIRNRNEVYSF